MRRHHPLTVPFLLLIISLVLGLAEAMVQSSISPGPGSVSFSYFDAGNSTNATVFRNRSGHPLTTMPSSSYEYQGPTSTASSLTWKAEWNSQASSTGFLLPESRPTIMTSSNYDDVSSSQTAVSVSFLTGSSSSQILQSTGFLTSDAAHSSAVKCSIVDLAIHSKWLNHRNAVNDWHRNRCVNHPCQPNILDHRDCSFRYNADRLSSERQCFGIAKLCCSGLTEDPILHQQTWR